jgi:hypothetical protein
MLMYVCLCILALSRIPDMILGDKSLISEVVLSQVPYSVKKLRFFTHVAPRTKSKGLPIDGPLLNKKKTYDFYTQSTAYKK